MQPRHLLHSCPGLSLTLQGPLSYQRGHQFKKNEPTQQRAVSTDTFRTEARNHCLCSAMPSTPEAITFIGRQLGTDAKPTEQSHVLLDGSPPHLVPTNSLLLQLLKFPFQLSLPLYFFLCTAYKYGFPTHLLSIHFFHSLERRCVSVMQVQRQGLRVSRPI